METVGIIAIIIIGLLVFSLLGWGVKLGGYAFDFLGEGCSTSFGCLFWVIAGIVLFLGLLAM